MVAAGLLCWLAWPPMPFWPLIFIAFVPLLIVEARISEEREGPSKWQVFKFAYLFFIVWNVSTTWWVWNASNIGSILAFVLNSLFMTTFIVLFHVTKKRLGNYLGYLSFPLYFLTFEYLHQNWEITWPWLTLGNVFAEQTWLIQWYEFTGTAGGGLWILGINLMVFLALRPFIFPTQVDAEDELEEQQSTKPLSVSTFWRPALAFLLPILISLGIYFTYSEQGEAIEVVVLQPNIDPYNEKFERGLADQQLEKFLHLSDSLLTPNTQFLVWPETSVPSRQRFWLDQVDELRSVRRIRGFLSKYPNLKLVAGIEPLKRYDKANGSPTARNFRNRENASYDIHNSAVLMDDSLTFKLYHKSKLVPGVERIPYLKALNFMSGLFRHLGGSMGSRATQEERESFFNDAGIGVAPVICYESVFGEYVTEYIQKGANFIFIITNDGWWGNTPGHKQHNAYASIRAIENRRSIARSANTGISCFIDQRGNIHQAKGWWQPDVIRQSIHANPHMTIYTRYGDYISRICLFLSAVLMLYTLLGRFVKRHKLSKN